jgi:hypothetical protein
VCFKVNACVPNKLLAEIERNCIARALTADLRRKLKKYLRIHTNTCRPFHWTYRSSRRCIHNSAA